MTQLVPEPTASTAKVELYPHAPTTLLPLLHSQLPHTIVLIGTILANRHSDADPAPITAPDVRVPPPLPPVYATFPPPSDGSDITSEYLAQIGVGEFDWLVVVALPVPSEQIRFYHSLVASASQTPEEKERAEGMIEAALRFMNTLYPHQLVSGCTHEMWEDVTRRVLGGKRQDPTLIYVAPGGGFGHTEIKDVGGWEGELVLDHGREGDKALVSAAHGVLGGRRRGDGGVGECKQRVMLSPPPPGGAEEAHEPSDSQRMYRLTRDLQTQPLPPRGLLRRARCASHRPPPARDRRHDAPARSLRAVPRGRLARRAAHARRLPTPGARQGRAQSAPRQVRSTGRAGVLLH